MVTVLIVDDNLYLSRVVHHVLQKQDFQSQSSSTLKQAFACIERQKFDLFIVDRVLPDGDGLEVVQYLQNTHNETPILIISEKGLVEDRIAGLERGADDYLPKPFSMEEFRLRVEKLMNRSKTLKKQGFSAGPLRLFYDKGEVWLKDKRLPLRKKEFDILWFLAKHQNGVVSREELLENIWPPDEIPTFATIDVYIRRIRVLLGRRKKMLKTLRGYGYMFQS